NRCNFLKPGVQSGKAIPEFHQLTSGTNGYNVDKNNLAPSVSVAWRPNVQTGVLRAILGNPDQATIRAGWSVAYSRHGMNQFTGVFGANPGSTLTLTRGASTGLVPAGESWPVLLSQTNRLYNASFPETPTFPIQSRPDRADTISAFAPDLTNIDITARCQAEERLQLAEKVFDNSPDAIMITDRDNRIVSVNEAFTLITGYAPDEVLGGNPRLLASGRHDDAFYAAMWRALREHGHWAGEIWDRRKSGEIYPKWMTINAVADRQSGELTHYVTMFSDITERKSSEERIHYLAHHDVLTGLPNRFTLGARLDQALVDARRHQWEVAVLFVDLDRFKIINDTLGHHIGDRLLIEVARRFSAVVRESDIVARLGGDEFVIVLPDLAGHADAATVAGKIIASLAVPVRIDDHELHTSPSIGISLFPTDGSDSDTILRNADTAMYHAKSLGRNNFQFYAEEMNRSTRERLDIERRLRQALARDEFELHYQPQFDTRAHRIAGVEALLRWNAGTGIPLGPDRFIPIAEESGLIVTLGEWVLRTACRQMKQWIDAGLPPLRVAVNVSPRQLHRQNFPEQVAAALAESGLPAHLLELEITESAVMEEPEEARAILVRLKEMGITLAIDDFGTGYSSLAYLKRFPIDHLKIDRSFVTDIERDANDAAIVVSIIALARSLGLKTIAEGVESDAQLALLREHGCDELQGYLFSRPLPAAAARDYLATALAAPAALPLSSS
ncbi:MAG: EAL domain-containing protein, partial [Proteobacteria bacterium]|nr:EAL domain-containing protein [Pseudomonadota bacterium]